MEWRDIEDISVELYDSHPDTDPLTVRFTQLLDWIMDLDEFEGVREESSEGRLEAIQMAWLEEYQLQKED